LTVKAGSHSFQQLHESGQGFHGQRPRRGGSAAVREGCRQAETAQLSGVTEVHEPPSLAASLLQDLDPLPR